MAIPTTLDQSADTAALALRKTAEARSSGFVGRGVIAAFGFGVISLLQSVELAAIWIAAVVLTQGVDYWLYRRFVQSDELRLPTRLEWIGCHVVSFCSTLAYSGAAAIIWFADASTVAGLAIVWICGGTLHVQIHMHHHRGLCTAALTGHLLYLFALPIISLLAFDGANMESVVAMVLGAVAYVAHLVAGFRLYSRISESLRHAKLKAEAGRRAAESANEAKSTFLAVMSHELRTPLNGVLGMTRALAGSRLDQQQKAYVETIIESGELLLHLLNDVLDISKIEAGRMDVEAIRVDLHDLIKGVASMWSTQAAAKRLAFHCVVDPEAPRWVLSDPVRLRQVLFNLLSNAVKFTSRGSVSVRVWASPAEDGAAKIHFAVRDTGPGIDAEHQQRLFVAFEQADNSTTREFGGTGLGLTISRRLARLMGGDVTVQSAIGEGSTFTLSVIAPICRPPAELVETSLSGVQTGEATQERLGARVLVADDNPVNQRVIAAFLADMACTLDIVDNGEEALAALANARYDAILMDAHMPVLDGISATRRLRAMGGPNAKTPVIALTSDATPGFETACRNAGMTHFILKPLDPREVHSALAAALGGGQETDWAVHIG